MIMLFCTGPKSALYGNNPLEFEISASGDDYIDLSQCYLSLKCKVKNSDGTDLRTQTSDADGNVTAGNQASVGPVNLFLHSLFRQVDVSFNDTLVSTSGDCYAYRAYITDLLSYGTDVKKYIWHKTARGLAWRRGREIWWAKQRRIDRKNQDDFKQQILWSQGTLTYRYVTPGATLTQQFNRENQSSASRTPFFINELRDDRQWIRLLSSRKLSWKHAKWDWPPKSKCDWEKVLAGPGAKYPITHAVTRHFTISSGTSTADLEALFMGQIPNKVVLGMISNGAFSGDWKKNPYRFRQLWTEFCMPHCRRETRASPAHDAWFFKGIICRMLSKSHESLRSVPQWFIQWNHCRSVWGWIVLPGVRPDPWWIWWRG